MKSQLRIHLKPKERIFINGTRLAWDTLYEWGVVVTDIAALSSEMVVVAATTPREDGEDGGAGR